MKNKLQILILILVFITPVFLCAFDYLTDAQYKRLSSGERARYLEDLKQEYDSLLSRKVLGDIEAERLEAEIADLRARIAELDVEIAASLARLGYTEQDITDIHTRIQYYKDQLNNWERMSDDELWRNATALKELEEDYLGTRAHKLARLPEFQRDFTDLDRRFAALNQALSRARGAGLIEHILRAGDTNTSIGGQYGVNSDYIGRVMRGKRTGDVITFNADGKATQWSVWRGESLWRISSYPEVYGSGIHWPAIYRANQNDIKDPDLIYPNQRFAIPQPLPANSTRLPEGYTPKN